MYKLLFALITTVFTCTSHAQVASAFYVELGGPGVASVNYDMRFTKSNGGIGGRIGFGGSSFDGETALFFPLAINYLFGSDDKHFFEVGAGGTIVTYNTSYDAADNGTFTESFGHLYFGYRVQPPNGGFVFRAGICPLFGEGSFIPYYAGVSFGYRFKSRQK
jgi:hypothetical protein